MERSDAVIVSVVQRRRAALLSVDWYIRVVAGGDDQKAETLKQGAYNAAARVEPSPPVGGKKLDAVLAEEQKELLRYAYDQIENFKDAVGWLLPGVFASGETLRG